MTEAVASLARDTGATHKPFYTFDTHPGRYAHWKLAFDGAVATLTMNVDEDLGLNPG